MSQASDAEPEHASILEDKEKSEDENSLLEEHPEEENYTSEEEEFEGEGGRIGFVYRLIGTDGYFYIGSTICTLARRLCGHKTRPDRRVALHYDQLGWDNVKMELISSHRVQTRDELFTFEEAVLSPLLGTQFCLNILHARKTWAERRAQRRINEARYKAKNPEVGRRAIRKYIVKLHARAAEGEQKAIDQLARTRAKALNKEPCLICSKEITHLGMNKHRASLACLEKFEHYIELAPRAFPEREDLAEFIESLRQDLIKYKALNAHISQQRITAYDRKQASK